MGSTHDPEQEPEEPEQEILKKRCVGSTHDPELQLEQPTNTILTRIKHISTLNKI